MNARLLFLLALFAAFIANPVLAQNDAAAMVTHLSGVLSVKTSAGESKFLSVTSRINNGDILTTEANSFARLRFKDNSELVMRPLTQIVIKNFSYEEKNPKADRSAVSLLKGGLRSASGIIGGRNNDKVEVATPVATIGIRGTVYEINFCEASCAAELKMDEGLYLHTLEGTIFVNNDKGGVELPKGSVGFAANASSVPTQIENKAQFSSFIPKSMNSSDSDSSSSTSDSTTPSDSAASTNENAPAGSCAVR